MESFEFVQIPVAIVLGFGISEILSGWGHQLRHRGEHRASALQLVASAYVLLWSFRYLWIQWATRPQVWDYAAYLLSVAPAVVLALAAHVIRFDPAVRSEDGAAGYERYRQPICWLLASVPILQLLRLFYVVGDRGYEAPVSARVLVVGGLMLISLVFVRLATTTRTSEQWIGWTINWVTVVVMASSILPDLANPKG